MDERENRRAMERLIQGFSERRLDLIDEQFHEDSTILYPQSGERIVGRANRRAVMSGFPGLPAMAPRRILVSGDLASAKIRMSYEGEQEYTTVFIFELWDDKIARETPYWTQPFEAAAWRAEWVERIPD